MAPLSLLPPTWSFPWRPLLSPFPWQPSPAMAEFPGSTPTPYSPPWSALELHSSPWRHPLQFPLCLGALPAPFLFSPCVQGALWPAPSNSNRVFFLPCCPRRAANRELSSISPHGRTQQQLAPPLLADAALSHGALQQMPWSIPSMPCDSVSFLRVCCCACTVDACWVLGKMCSSPDVAARLAALCCAANNTPGCPSGEESRVLRGEEGKPLDARRCSERCTSRNRHRPYKHRLGLFMDRGTMIEPVMWCQPQDAVGGRPKEWWTYPVDARQASTHPSKHYLSVK
ncbi:uncharacterized protein, partial [Zea mays]|uniref:uncharacterized protein n=1 Tax=Zea mays TaxID=4577 RepID=UPI001652CD86